MSTPANGTRPRKPKAGKTVSRVATPKALSIPKPKRERYLELVASGIRIDEAARKVGATPRLMRSLARNDPGFAALRDAAIEEARQERLEEYVPVLREARRKLAVDELDSRMLHYESIAHDPDYRAAHQKSEVALTGPNGGPLEVKVDVTFPQLREELARRAAPYRAAVEGAGQVVELRAAGSPPGRVDRGDA